MKVFRFDIFTRYPQLVAGVATNELGNMSFRYGEYSQVRQNRKAFFRELTVPENQVATAQLLHGHRILDITEKEWSRGIVQPEDSLQGDILVTDKPETFLFFVVADCLALFFFEPDKQVIALSHAGWRGVEQEVPKLTVEHMVKRYGCSSKNILVGMSPALQQESACFDQVEQQESAKKDAWAPYIKKKDNLFCIGTSEYAYDQLLATGISESHIERSLIDTRHSNNFYSHRRSEEEHQPEARFGCLIGLKNTR